MRAKQLYSFARPTLAIVVCFMVAWLCASSITRFRANRSAPAIDRVDDFVANIDSVVEPSAEFEPDDVVRIQLTGLADTQHASGIYQCMRFASPDNLIVTGPLERFGELVRRPPYDVLASPDGVIVGKPIYLNGKARVLVTLIESSRLHLFVWVLSKQTDTRYEGCWMTDAVFPLLIPAKKELAAEQMARRAANSLKLGYCPG